MNIVRALDVALPELPERLVRRNLPKLDPTIISKQHVENDQPVVLVKKPGTDLVFRFAPAQWQLVQLFDGKRSFAEVAELYSQESRAEIAEDSVRELASYLQSDTPLLYKTPLEQNIMLQQELRTARKKRSRFQIADFSDITVRVWDNADAYVTWLYPKLRFLFTAWFVWASLGMFVLMGWMWADRLGEIWSDSFAFYNFTEKSLTDLLEFWFLFGAMAGIHETAHGLVGKHFGARIERMGFTLMYFAPSFFCDATQVWVLAGKWARIATAIAGIWLDLVICFLATVIWFATASGMAVHDWSYKIMMVTGIGVSLLNLNPLIKLDGYLIFSELVHEPALKEESTEYLSAWVRRNIFGLPVEVPYVARKKRPFYFTYAILSGLYSYSLLSFLMVITYHILQKYSPEWAFIPALAIGYWVFRARIRLAVKFMRIVYLDKKESAWVWLRSRQGMAYTIAFCLFVFLPVWPEFVKAPFVLEASHRVQLHAMVPGTVSAVFVKEGDELTRGTPVLRMHNLQLESERDAAQADQLTAAAKARQASLSYADLATAQQQERQAEEILSVLSARMAQLSVISPIHGVVVTAHPADLVGSSPDRGDPLIEVSDTSWLNARIYVPEFAMRDVGPGGRVRLLVPGRLMPVNAVLGSLSATEASIPKELVSQEQLQGLNPPHFYVGLVTIENDGNLREGIAGTAKLFVRKTNIAAQAWRFTRDLVNRKIW